MDGSTSTAADAPDIVACVAGSGVTGALMRDMSWASCSLGSPETWPHWLRSAVSLMQGSGFPMFLATGPELGFLYNDAYAEILGNKHPAAMGARFQDVWAEIWSDLKPFIDKAMRGKATWVENYPLTMHRHGYNEPTWFTFSYSPLRDEDGRVAGLFCACTETTGRVRAEEALREGRDALPQHGRPRARHDVGDRRRRGLYLSQPALVRVH